MRQNPRRTPVAAAIVGLGLLAIAGCDSPTRDTGMPPISVFSPTPAPPATAAPEPAVTPPAVAPGAPLAATCQATPRSGMAPLRVEFAAAAAGGDGAYAYAWSFGDGATAGTRNPAYVYEVPGTFTASVRASSGDETATCTREITVTAAAPGPAPAPSPIPTPTPSPSPTPSPTPTPAPQRVLTVTFDFQHSNVPGTVIINPGPIACVNSCSAAFAQGTLVTISAFTDGVARATISGACYASNQEHAECSVTMTADRQVSVWFFRVSAVP
jgi:PKD repeat protein